MRIPLPPRKTSYLRALIVVTPLLLTGCAAPGPDPFAGTSTQPGQLRTLTGHELWVETVAWSPDGKLVASGAGDTTVRVWNPDTGEQVQLLHDFNGGIAQVAWSPDSKYLALVANMPRNQVQIWDAATWSRVHAWTSQREVSSVAWSPDGRSLAVGTGGQTLGNPSGESSLDVYDVSSGQAQESLMFPTVIAGVAWAPNGQYIAFGTSMEQYTPDPRGRVVLWEPAKGGGPSTGQNTRIWDNPRDDVLGLAWAPNSQTLATAGQGNTVLTWDIARTRITGSFGGFQDGVTDITWTPDGLRLAAGSRDRTARVWDVASGALLATLRHPDYVIALGWAPDSQRLVTGSADHNVRIWKVK